MTSPRASWDPVCKGLCFHQQGEDGRGHKRKPQSSTPGMWSFPVLAPGRQWPMLSSAFRDCGPPAGGWAGPSWGGNRAELERAGNHIQHMVCECPTCQPRTGQQGLSESTNMHTSLLTPTSGGRGVSHPQSPVLSQEGVGTVNSQWPSAASAHAV